MSDTPSRLQRELQQRKPFRSVSQEAVVALFRTADRVKRRFEVLIAEHGLTFAQYNVLRILRGAGPEGLCTLEVGERLIERAPGITRLLDRLEAAGHVTRERSTEDRREVRCRLTRSGAALLARIDPAIDALDDTILAPLTAAQLRELLALLEPVRARLEPDVP